MTSPGNGIPIKGSNLVEQLRCMMDGCYYPGSGTFGNWWMKRVLEEFILNSGMPLAHATIKDATDLDEAQLKRALDGLTTEGYIKQNDSPASFLFQGADGDSYSLVMDADEAQEAAQEVQGEGKVSDASPAQVAQPTQAGDAAGTGSN